MKKFLKDTRGVVMMEYIILGCFAVAITVAAVLTLGKVYNNGLATMAFATAGETVLAKSQAIFTKSEVSNDLADASENYADKFAAQTDAADDATAVYTYGVVSAE